MSDESAAPTGAGPTKQTETETQTSSNLTCCLKGQDVSELWDICADHTCDQALHPNRPRCKIAARLIPNCQCKENNYYNLAGYCVPKEKCKNPVKIPPKPKCADNNTQLVGCLQPKDFPYCGLHSSQKRRHHHSSSSSSSLSSSSSSGYCSHRSHPSPFVEFIKRHQNSTLSLRNVCVCKDTLCLDDCGVCVKVKKYQKNKKCHRIQCNGANEEVYRDRCVCKKHHRINKCKQCVSKEEYENTKHCLCSCQQTFGF